VTGIGFGVPYNSIDFADISAVDPNNLLNNTTSSQYESRLASVFVRGEYQYANKYLFSAIVRRDGSSNFGNNNRFGVFPSLSAAWIFSEEDFLKSSILTFGKLRTSFGISGNDKIGLFRYRGLLNGEAEYPFNDQLVTGVALGALGNPDLRWEQTTQFNVGLDLTFLKGDLTASIDYFNKTTKDLLFTPDVTGVLGSYGAGGLPPTVNAGSVLNSGLELALSYNKTLSNGLGFNVSYNIATLHNQVLSLAAGQDFIPTGAFGVGGITSSRFQVGQPMGYFFGYKTDGIYQNKEQVAAAPTQDGAQAGDIKYKDLNGDGKIDFSGNTDKTIIGSPIPDVTMGLNLGVNFKGFDVSTLIYGSFGNEILRNYERQTPLANMLNYKLARWTGEGSTNEHPRLTTGSNRNNIISEYYVEDGSFVRFKNVQLGYTIPTRLLEKIKIQRCRVYFAVNNLLTITKYRGFDPDLGSSDPLSSGIDFGFYPQARSYMLGLNVGF
jgi:TonB-dependent starch-binding outer membrane protein SusC